MTTLTSPIDLLNAIPFLIGYQPKDSIVLISLREEAIDLAMRIDFPQNIDFDQIQTLVGHLTRNGAEAAIIVSYIPDSTPDADLVLKCLAEAIEESAIPVTESLVIVGERWRSTLCVDESCCPPEGSALPLLTDSRIAAEQVALGRPIPFPSQEALVESLTPLKEEAKVAEIISTIEPFDYSFDPSPRQRKGAQTVLDFLYDFEADGTCRDLSLVAEVLVSLQDLQVRDFALGTISDEKSDLYFAAWRWLMRIAPATYIAPPATIFAVLCYERGDGAMANRALDRAVSDNPNYALTSLLREVFTEGMSPSIFKTMRRELHPKVCEAIFSGTMKP